MNFSKEFAVKPGQKVNLTKFDPDDTGDFTDKAKANRLLKKNRDRLGKLQYLLYAENKRAVLVIFQAMDAGGKDGAIRNVFSGVDPHGCHVTSFKSPSLEELEHDFLWRIHRAAPMKGEIGIFNRSQYEDVLIARVRKLVPKEVWSKRYDQINRFERNLAANDVTILKFFLHISEDEQKERLQARLKDPEKNWKFNPGDLDERKLWDDYTEAYEDALSRCSTEWAPWFIIPSNKKWFRSLAVSEIVVESLGALDMKFPKPKCAVSKIVVE